MKDIWNARYNSNDYIYGKRPNEFLKDLLDGLKPGSILLPADGEGRNSVFAASLGWDVDAFDYSESAKNKALQLAKINNVKINYEINDISTFTTKKQYDVIALIYLHLPSELRISFFQKLNTMLKPDGIILMEAFSKKQINYSSGGPKDQSLLYDLNQIRSDFKNFNIKELTETEIILDEGTLHQGLASVIRLIGYKN